MPHLTVVIPALNEEEAIAQTVERCLAARTSLRRACDIEMQIVVVSDGSTDGTVQLAEAFEEVEVLVLRENRGYGGAIKAGFEHGTGELVGFLDADGTCDPEFFVDLCSAIQDGADVALGSRMGPGSEMPAVRRLGNRIFATMLSILSRRSVVDSASGMRVIRRSALERLAPLPDGLHYTPAMSARALMRSDIRIVELPMSYSERLGRSKLSVGRDGVRFLGVILSTVMMLRPARLLLLAAAPLALMSLLLSLEPILHYLRERSLEEWMIYRLLLATILGVVTTQCVTAAAVAEKIAALADRRPAARRGITGLLRPLFSPWIAMSLAGLLVLAAITLVWPGLTEYLRYGTVTMHWSRAVLGGLLVTLGSGIGVTSALLVVLDLLVSSAREIPVLPPDRVRPATPK